MFEVPPAMFDTNYIDIIYKINRQYGIAKFVRMRDLFSNFPEGWEFSFHYSASAGMENGARGAPSRVKRVAESQLQAWSGGFSPLR
jgi:hypothetical protein